MSFARRERRGSNKSRRFSGCLSKAEKYGTTNNKHTASMAFQTLMGSTEEKKRLALQMIRLKTK